jgi:hypothetical protein
MSIVVRPSCLCVPFSEKLDNLLDCLINRCMILKMTHYEWARGNQNDVHTVAV